MIDSLYNVTRKGWLKALSFILAAALFVVVLLKSSLFAQQFGGQVPYLAVLVFYGMSILWIHGVGLEIKLPLWQAIFLPLIGYLIIIPTLGYLILS